MLGWYMSYKQPNNE